MVKEGRLSFRISDNLNNEIDRMVIIKRDVRDRSDFGNQAMEFYLKLLKDKQVEEQDYLKLIEEIAEKTGNADLEEIKKVKEKSNWFKKLLKDPHKGL